MPKLKESPQQQFYNKLSKDIQKKMIDAGIGRKELADRACIHYNTLSKRLKQPDTWIMWELVAVAGILKMDLGGFYGAEERA